MNLVLWIAQGLIGAAFTLAGLLKSTQPVDKLAEKMPWVRQYSPGMVRFIGLSELAGGLGLILPWATGILPILTPLAAIGLVLVMVLAAVHHARHDGGKGVPINIVLGALAAFIAWGRL